MRKAAWHHAGRPLLESELVDRQVCAPPWRIEGQVPSSIFCCAFWSFMAVSPRKLGDAGHTTLLSLKLPVALEGPGAVAGGVSEAAEMAPAG